MKRKLLLLPIISLLFCALLMVPSAFIYQHFKQLLTPTIYIIPNIHWDQGLRSASLQLEQIKLPMVEVSPMVDIVNSEEKKSVPSAAPKKVRYVKTHYPKIKVAAVALQPSALQSLPETSPTAYQVSTASALKQNEVNNRQLIVHQGFSWKHAHLSSINLLALLEQYQIEKELLALEVQRISQENQQRLAKKVEVQPTAPIEPATPDLITTSQSATQKEYKELLVESDLDTQSSDSVPGPQVDPQESQPPVSPVAEIVESLSQNQAQEEAPVAPVQAKQTNSEPSDAALWADWQAQPISSGVAQAIASAKIKMSSQIPSGHQAKASDYSKRVAMVTTQVDRESRESEKADQSLSQVEIRVSEVKIGVGFDKPMTHFDFAPAYAGTDERISDDQGIILLENILSAGQGILSGSILKDGHMPLKVDLSLDQENELTEINLPLISTTDFISFLEKQNLMGEGAHFLAEVAEGIVDVELDQSYESKIYLSSDFKIVKEGEAFSFVMIIGAKSGNALLSYLFEDGEAAERLIHLPEGQIAYDYAQMRSKRTSRFKLMQQLPLASKPMPFDTNERYVGLFNSEVHSSQQAPGVYDLKLPAHPAAHRQYLELKHIEGSLFVGINGDATIDVPSDHLFVEVFNQFALNSLEGLCMVQLNLSKQAYKISYAGESKDHGMQVRSLYLEKNGKFEAELSPISKKGFLVGEEQGVINLKIDYLDDSTEYLQTFCSPNTYLIEQL